MIPEVEYKPSWNKKNYQVSDIIIGGVFIGQEHVNFGFFSTKVWYIFQWNFTSKEAEEFKGEFQNILVNPDAYAPNFFNVIIEDNQLLAETFARFLYQTYYGDKNANK